MFSFILAWGWLPAWIGLHCYFKYQEKKTVKEASKVYWDIINSNPELKKEVLSQIRK